MHNKNNHRHIIHNHGKKLDEYHDIFEKHLLHFDAKEKNHFSKYILGFLYILFAIVLAVYINTFYNIFVEKDQLNLVNQELIKDIEEKKLESAFDKTVINKSFDLSKIHFYAKNDFLLNSMSISVINYTYNNLDILHKSYNISNILLRDYSFRKVILNSSIIYNVFYKLPSEDYKISYILAKNLSLNQYNDRVIKNSFIISRIMSNFKLKNNFILFSTILARQKVIPNKPIRILAVGMYVGLSDYRGINQDIFTNAVRVLQEIKNFNNINVESFLYAGTDPITQKRKLDDMSMDLTGRASDVIGALVNLRVITEADMDQIRRKRIERGGILETQIDQGSIVDLIDVTGEYSLLAGEYSKIEALVKSMKNVENQIEVALLEKDKKQKQTERLLQQMINIR